MKKLKLNLNIDWQSKIMDLIIVILGITIAFQLNNWNENVKTNAELKSYVESFLEENTQNEQVLISAIDFSKKVKKDIDTLKFLLVSNKYTDVRIISFSGSMMALASYNPTTTTMENIIASGEFELISNIELRKNIINTYKAYENTKVVEDLLSKYLERYVTPFFFEHVSFSDFSSIHDNFIENPKFENIVTGYEVLLNQQILGYEANLDKVKELNSKLKSELDRLK